MFEVIEPLVLKPGISLVSQAGPSQTILKNTAFIPRGMLISDGTNDVTIEGLTITHGSAFQEEGGGGILIRNCNAVVRNNLIVSNASGGIEGTGGRGCGVSVIGGSPTLEHNTIVSNYCDFGAIDIYATTALIQFNIVAYTSNEPISHGGMGISCEQSSGALVAHNLFWGNRLYDVAPRCSTDATLQDNVIADPKFCDPISPPADGYSGDWRVALNSPAAAGGPCAGWGAPLEPCPFTAAQPTSWGKLKAIYRQ